jgi:hypothetical protein
LIFHLLVPIPHLLSDAWSDTGYCRTIDTTPPQTTFSAVRQPISTPAPPLRSRVLNTGVEVDTIRETGHPFSLVACILYQCFRFA